MGMDNKAEQTRMSSNPSSSGRTPQAASVPETLLVVPCYNEAKRLPVEAFASFIEQNDDTGVLFVDDGSTDHTASIIDALTQRHPSRFFSLQLERNLGKGEAVRSGVLKAIEMGPAYVGYWDADLSTPLDELPRFIALYREMPDKVMLAGSRVKLVGRVIERRAIRHYLGRIYATAVTVLLNIPMYDTQCGAKLFRCTPLVASAFGVEFHSRWQFDIELILRIRHLAAARNGAPIGSLIYEVPLNMWRDVPGSKISFGYFLWAGFDLIALYFRYRRKAKHQWARGPDNDV